MSTPLHILHISPYGPEAWGYGGIPRVVSGLTRGLARRGHRVTLCTTDVCDGHSRLPRGDGSFAGAHSPKVVDGVEWRIFPNLSNRAAYHLQAFAPLGLRGYLQREVAGFDAVHIHACHNVLGIAAARAADRAGVPWLLSPNGTAPVFERRLGAKRVLQWAGGHFVLAGASRVLAVSAAEERQLLALGVSRQRIRRVPNPLDSREFRTEHGAPRFIRDGSDGPVVLFLGKITPRKHVDVVVEAFSRLNMQNARLVLAGNDLGGLARAISRVRALNLESRTTTPGLLCGSARLQAMANADVVVYPSEAEVFGLVPCEAIMLGTPVIVGADSGCAEVVGPCGAAVVSPGDPGALSEAIEGILRRPSEWRTRVAAGSRRLEMLYDEATVAATLENVYLEMAGLRTERLSA